MHMGVKGLSGHAFLGRKFKLTQLETTTIYCYFFPIWRGHRKLAFLLLPVDPRHYLQILFQGIKQAYLLLLMSRGEDSVVQCLRANILPSKSVAP